MLLRLWRLRDMDINDNVLYPAPHYQTVASWKPTTAAQQKKSFDCLFAATSITVRERPINQADSLTYSQNYLFDSGHFLRTAAGFVQLLSRFGLADEYQ